MYFVMKARHSIVSGSSFQVGSVGSFKQPAEMMPCDASRPAAFMTDETDEAMLGTKKVGFQPSSWTFLMVCAVALGAAQEKKMSAPEARRATTWESSVGSVTS